MVRITSLDDIAQDIDDQGHTPADADRLLASPSEKHRVIGLLLKAGTLYRAGDLQGALDLLLTTRRYVPYVPLPVISPLLALCERLGYEQRAAHECLAFARDSIRMGYLDLGLEAASSALIFDTRGSFELTRDPVASSAVASLYTQVSRRLPKLPPSPSPPHPPPFRIALVVSNLVDHVVAYTKRILQFARHLDRERYRLSVYVTENLAGRTHPLFPYGCLTGSTGESGAETLAELHRLGIPVHLESRALPFLVAAQSIARRLHQDGNHAAIVQASLACPIDWLALSLAPLPVKVSIHIGSTLFLPGLDATFYDNPANLERENLVWHRMFGDRILLPKGTDLQELASQPPLPRASFGIPPDAVILGTLSNHLERRLSPEYLDVIAATLRAEPKAWFLAFGAESVPLAQHFFTAHGVADRVRFGGKQLQAGAALKTLDLYACEFPVGGSQSVLEAMACGLPVLALRWSDAHAESSAAQLVGPTFSIPTPDVHAYRERLLEWIRKPTLRRAVAAALLQKAETEFSAVRYVRDVVRHVEEIYARKTQGGAG